MRRREIHARELTVFLILEILSVVWATLMFSMLPKLLAGALAGLFFLGFTTYMLVTILKSRKPFKTYTLYPLVLFWAGSVLPLLIVRFSHPDVPFSNLRILGLSAAEFHRLAGATFGLLLLVNFGEVVVKMIRKVA